MKVRCVRKNAYGMDIGKAALNLFDQSYDRNSPPKEKEYRPGIIGYQSHVYALRIIGGHVFYYIRDPDFGEIYHAPSVCFDVIDNRLSSYWHMRHKYVHRDIGGPLGKHFTSTFIAIREWIDEPGFLNNYVDGRKREVEIMEAAAKLIEAEFD